jgi:hypothetical protein
MLHFRPMRWTNAGPNERRASVSKETGIRCRVWQATLYGVGMVGTGLLLWEIATGYSFHS